VLAFLIAAALCAGSFPVLYALDRLPRQTQLLGLSLGLSFAFLAAACIVTAKRLVVTEELEEAYPPPAHPAELDALEQIVAESGDRISRKRLLKLGAGAAGAALGAALLTPAVSLGPLVHMAPFYATPWRRGRRLVDERGRPYRAGDIEEASFYTAFPEGADREELGAPVVLIRLDPKQLALPSGRSGWAPHGILAYSKICTHAGCAISLYRSPLFAPAEPRPALVCPCHYSTFDPAHGGTVLFGPAGRPLPQLPLLVDSAGYLRAAGNFSGPVGPAWWGVHLRGARGPSS
jgi:ubiquinol-cytochrome c reductase iron-sulfur subunit